MKLERCNVVFILFASDHHILLILQVILAESVSLLGSFICLVVVVLGVKPEALHAWGKPSSERPSPSPLLSLLDLNIFQVLFHLPFWHLLSFSLIEKTKQSRSRSLKDLFSVNPPSLMDFLPNRRGARRVWAQQHLQQWAQTVDLGGSGEKMQEFSCFLSLHSVEEKKKDWRKRSAPPGSLKCVHLSLWKA